MFAAAQVFTTLTVVCVVAQNIEERVMMLRDAVLNTDCQLYHDPVDAHNKNLFG